MCCTCDASRLIEAKGNAVTFAWKDAKAALDLQAIGTSAEGPARFRVRRHGDSWSPWYVTDDLAGSILRLGTDVKWSIVKKEVKEWLRGGSFKPVDELLRA